MNEGLIAILVLVGLVAVIYILIAVSEKRSLKKAAQGSDKEKLERAVAAALPGEYGYQTLYVRWEDRRRYGRTVETSYYNYAIAFKADEFWVLPVYLREDEVAAGSPTLYSLDILGCIATEPHRKKGELWRLDTSLYDGHGSLYLRLRAESANIQSDSSLFNLLQQKECDDFYETLKTMSARVNPSHSSIEEGLSRQKTDQIKKKAVTAAILSFLLSFIPIFSIPAAFYSIYWSVKARQAGGRAVGALILAVLGLVSSIGLIAVLIFSELSLLF